LICYAATVLSKALAVDDLRISRPPFGANLPPRTEH